MRYQPYCDACRFVGEPRVSKLSAATRLTQHCQNPMHAVKSQQNEDAKIGVRSIGDLDDNDIDRLLQHVGDEEQV